MKDAQQILRHASIKTTAEIYMQEIQASVRSAINSRTREIYLRHVRRVAGSRVWARQINSFGLFTQRRPVPE